LKFDALIGISEQIRKMKVKFRMFKHESNTLRSNANGKLNLDHVIENG